MGTVRPTFAREEMQDIPVLELWIGINGTEREESAHTLLGRTDR